MKLMEIPQAVIRANGVPRRRKRWLQWLFRALLSVVLLAFVLRSVELTLFWTAVRSVDMWCLSAAIALFFAGQLWAAYRWYFLLTRLGRPLPFWSTVRYTLLGQISALFLPGQISGDIVRAMAVARGKREKASYALSVIVDKVALLGALASFVLFGGLWSRQLSGLVAIHAIALGLLVLSLLMMIFLCRYRSDHVPRGLMQIGNRLPFTRSYVLSLAGWLDLPRLSYRTMLFILAMAFGLQLSHTVGSYLFARSLDITISVVDWAAINAAVSVLQALPITLGGLGVRDGVFAATLALYDIPRAQATAFSLASFVLVAFLTTLGWFVLDSAFVHRLQAMMYPVSEE